jgi:hypothetical protein
MMTNLPTRRRSASLETESSGSAATVASAATVQPQAAWVHERARAHVPRRVAAVLDAAAADPEAPQLAAAQLRAVEWPAA